MGREKNKNKEIELIIEGGKRKMKKLLAVLVTAGMMVSIMTSCSKPTTTEKVKIGVSMGELTSEFCEGLRDGAVEKITELGGEAVYLGADSDATKQSTQIQDLIAQGCKAIVVFATDTDAIMASAKACKDAGVLFAQMSRISPDLANIDLAVGFDNKDQAIQCGEAIVAQAKALGYTTIKCIELVGSLTDQNAIERQTYFEEFAAANKITIVQKVLTDWNADQAYAGLKDAITAAGKDFNAIYCPSDFLFGACESALTENNIYKTVDEKGHVILVGIDGGPNAMLYVRSGYADMTCNTDVMVLGRDTVTKVFDMLANGTKYSAAVMIKPFPITKANVDDKTLWGNVYAPEK